MKHLLKFDESNSNLVPAPPILTDDDFEKIENCFLDYFDQDRCWSERELRLVKIKFIHPEDQTYDLCEELRSDVKRCESYGFECHVSAWRHRPLEDLQGTNRLLVIRITKI